MNEEQPAGAAHDTPRLDPLGVLTGIVLSEDRHACGTGQAAVSQAEDADAGRSSVQTAIERFAAEAEMVYTARTAAVLDRLTAEGALTGDERRAFAGEVTDSAALARLLRSAELAGHDPDRVLSTAVAERSFEGARSLPQVVYRRIERQLGGQLSPVALNYAEMIPAVASTSWREQLASRAEAADNRRRELGVEAAQDPPQWAAEALGPVPTQPLARLDWEDRAGVVSAWRELAGHADAEDALGAAPRPGKPEHYASWRAAWTALGRPEAERAEAEMSYGQLLVRVRAYEREKTWAPAYVGESLTATSLAAESRRRNATLTTARADAASDPVQRTSLTASAADDAALADVFDARVAELQAIDDARAEWLAHTAVTRDAALRARDELATRGAPVGAEAEDAVTADEWLTEHRADAARTDVDRPVTAEHDLADIVEQRARDTGMTMGTDEATAVLDIREMPAVMIVDEPGRIPAASETQAAVRQAQAALEEIRSRRALEDQHDAEEQRVGQLARWAGDDAARADEHADVMS